MLGAMLLVGATLLWTGIIEWPLAGDRGLAEALVQRGRVVVVGSPPQPPGPIKGTELLALQTQPELAKALAGSAPEALLAAMDAAKIRGLLVETAGEFAAESLAGGMARYAHIDDLRGLHLTPRAALYAPDPTRALSETDRYALATVARRIVGGARPPRITSFPARLRALRPAEVMVLLRQGPRPRLWRSARGNSIARALVTASVVARKRWTERESSMGGPIDRILPRLQLEVALLSDDGTVGSSEPGFIDRVFSDEHGVAYEHKGAWRYLLPNATAQAGGGSASAAYHKLFKDDGLPPDSFGRPDTRIYRLWVETLASTEPPANRAEAEPGDGLGEVVDPAEVLDGGTAGAD